MRPPDEAAGAFEMSEPVPFITMGDLARELALTSLYTAGLFVGFSLAAGLTASPAAFIALALWTLH